MMNEARSIAVMKEIFAGALAKGALDLRDDAALLAEPAAGCTRVICADQMIEDVHFANGLGDAADAGYRALVRNLSDLAAMGAKPVGFLWTLAIPEAWLSNERMIAFWTGAAEAAAQFSCPLLGGDLGRSAGPLLASVTAIGDVAGAPMLRSGAQIGDRLYVSRPLGASAHGLDLLRGPSLERPVHAEPNVRERTDEQQAQAILAHLRPVPELALGQALVGRASACMDVSDGFLLDLSRLLSASGCGAELGDLSSIVDRAADLGMEPSAAGRQRALGGGEDYALLYAAPPNIDVPGIAIGFCREELGVVERSGGVLKSLAPQGYEHF